MATVVVKHKVRDFKVWLSGFQKDSDNRRNAGIHNVSVHQTLEDPNDVVVVLRVDDPSKFKAILASPEHTKIREEAGVIGNATVFVLNDGQKFDH